MEDNLQSSRSILAGVNRKIMKIYGNVTLSEGSDVKNLTIATGSVYPSNANVGELFYHSVNGLMVHNGTTWIPASNTSTISYQTLIDTLGYTPLNKAGDNILGSLSFPKTSGAGVKIENQYGWKDLIGDITPRSGGTNAPTLKNFIGTIREYSYIANDQGDTRFHLPHDYAPGTDLYIHVHWGHNGTNISGSFRVDFNITYAKGHNQASFSTPITETLLVSPLNITNAPQYIHRVDEIQLSSAGGVGGKLNTDLIEVDGVLLINYNVVTIPTITGGTSAAPFLFTVDLHYQSTGLATKNKAPNFYG